MKLLLQVIVCAGLSVIFKNLLFAYWRCIDEGSGESVAQ